MSRRFGAAVVGLALLCGCPAVAGTGYQVMAQNDSAGPLTVSVDGKASCVADAGKSCAVTFEKDSAVLTYSLAGAPPIVLKPGNLEIVDTCHIDARGARCIDTMGKPTN